MSKMSKCFCITLITLISQALWAQEWTEIIQKELNQRAERSPSIRLTIEIESHKSNGLTSRTKLLVFAHWDETRGEKQSIAYTLEPAADRGKIYLQLGRKYWIYFPKAKRTMPISAQTSMQGEVSNGDILAPLELSLYDYQINSGKTAEQTELLLTAKNRDAPYGKVIQTYRRNSLIAAKLFSRSGILIKDVVYDQHYDDSNGYSVFRYSKITNKIKAGNYSVIHMSKQELYDIPKLWFNPNNLSRIRPR